MTQPAAQPQAYLQFTGPEWCRIGGVGDFSRQLPALPVSEAIASQYDTEEMRARGWVVTRIPDDHSPAVPLSAQEVRVPAAKKGDKK